MSAFHLTSGSGHQDQDRDEKEKTDDDEKTLCHREGKRSSYQDVKSESEGKDC